jgi:hypothetical protein
MADDRDDDGIDKKVAAVQNRLSGALHDLADRIAQARRERITESIVWLNGGVERLQRVVDRALGRKPA